MKRKKPAGLTKAFEDALKTPPEVPHFLLRLFVTGTTPRSLNAIRNIRAICDDRLSGRYDLSVVDIYQHPDKAGPEQIVVAPTLVKMQPLPVRRLIGDLSDTPRVLAGLGLLPGCSPAA